MTSGDSYVHNGRELPDEQHELQVTPMGDLHREDWMEYKTWESVAHRNQLKYNNLLELPLDRT